MEATSSKPRLLLVEDDAAVMDAIGLILEEAYTLSCATSIAQARALLATEHYVVALLDKNLPDGTGLDLAEFMAKREMSTEIVLMTAFGSLASAQRAMELGVHEYLEKPFPTPDIVLQCLERAARAHELKEQQKALVRELTSKNLMLEEIAVRDPTTRLFNHDYLQGALDQEIQRSSRYRLEFSILLCDIDNFAMVNGALGTRTGDKLLAMIGELISGASRMIDMPFEPGTSAITARFGGNSFALLLPQTSKHGAATVAERLREAVSRFDVSSVGIAPQTVSVGFATFPDDARDRGRLLAAVEAAKLSAKQQGKNCVIGYDDALDAVPSGPGSSDARTLHARALREAIRDVAFDHVYQPVVRASDLTVVAYEALVRPRSPFPDPLTLIKTAVLSGQTLALGQAIRSGSTPAMDQFAPEALLFTNLHPDEVRVELVDELALAPWRHRIVLEVTEVAKIQDYERVRFVLSALREAGFRIALDDLGAGYSGLNSLAQLEPDFVKLDIELVRAATSSARSARLARHLVEYCEGEGMQVVAEGIETDAEYDLLRSLGCPLMQGYRFGRPAAIGDILK